MELRSPVLITELMFPRFDGRVVDRGDYLVVHTPNNPGFYWGNFVVFAEPIAPQRVAEAEAVFARELGGEPGVRHVTLTWDAAGLDGVDLGAYEGHGWTLEESIGLVSEAPCPPAKRAAGIAIRRHAGDADWTAMERLNIEADPLDGKGGPYAAFKRALRARYRVMVEAGRGVYLGAWDGDVLAGQMGIYFEGRWGRFQAVETHPDHRRRGICSALCAEATRLGFEERGAARIAVSAEPDYHAIDIYRRAGFRDAVRHQGIYRPPPESTA